MKSRTPAIALGLLSGVFLVCVAFSASGLPDHLATHFNASGRPDGWMPRASYLQFIIAFGLGLPFLVTAIFGLIPFLPIDLINIPRRDYWLGPERRDQSFAFLFHHSLWFACLGMAFVIGIHLLVLQANRAPEPRLSTPAILSLGGCFMAGVVLWIVMLVRHFKRAPDRPENNRKG